MRISDWSSDVCSSDLHRRLADYHASTMVDHDAAAEACGRMDVDVEDFRGPALQQEGHGLTVLVPQPVGDTMGLDRLEALEEQQRLQEAAAGGIALVHRHGVGAHRIADEIGRAHV